MSTFEFVGVLLSIVIGFALTQVLQGLRCVLLARSRVRLHGPTFAWAGILLVAAIQMWWSLFALRGYEAWSLAPFFVLMLQTIGMYMAAALVFPDIPSGERVDLAMHYHANRGWFFGVLIATLAASLAKDLLLRGSLPPAANLAFHVSMIAACAAGAFVAAAWFHRALAAVVAVLVIVYAVVLFGRLPGA